MTIDVGEKTTLEGALINSETGELFLSTNELEVRDLGDSEVYSNRGGMMAWLEDTKGGERFFENANGTYISWNDLITLIRASAIYQ